VEKIYLEKNAIDGVVVKMIQFDQVKTTTIINEKPGFTKTHDIKRLGFKSVEEYIDYLKSQGYEIKKEVEE
jgi:hypothetical protein